MSLFFSNFFQSFIPAGKSMPLQSYWSTNGMKFTILSRWFLIFWWFNATIMEYAKDQLHLVFLGFIVAFLLAIHSGDLIY